MKHITFLFLCIVFLASCQQTELKEPLEYKGPMREAEKVELFHTVEERIKLKMTAPLLYEFASQDREFPKGVYIEFYDAFGKLESVLKADHAYFFRKDNLWRGRGNVEVKNVKNNEQLNTEELFWKQIEKKIFTEKFVTIRQQGDVYYGEGLEAKEDLSNYVIHKLSGVMDVNE